MISIARAIVILALSLATVSAIGQSNDPSLKETLEWMKTTISDHPEREVLVDRARLLQMAAHGPAYNEDGVDSRKGDHLWQWTRTETDLSYEGCSVTFQGFYWSTGEVTRKNTHGVIEYVHPAEHVSLRDKMTVDLGKMTPESVKVDGPFVSEGEKNDLFVNSNFSARGQHYVDDNGAVTAKYADEKRLDLLLVMEYAYAERFAKALKHAIVKCGGHQP